MILSQWLLDLETQHRNTLIDEVVLWSGSVTQDMQVAVSSMYGLSDLDDDPRSRPNQIVSALDGINPASILDICCGDALVLWKIKRAFPDSECLGVDMNKGNTNLYDRVVSDGVKVYRVPMQSLFSSDPPSQLNVTMMLNTYRGWGSARLRESERDLPYMALTWMRTHSLASILTATESQVSEISELGDVRDIGTGEQGSRMILVEWRHT